LDEQVYWGVELYEILLGRYGIPQDDGFTKLRALPADKANEATRLFRDWLTFTREVVLPAVAAVERADRTIVSNAPHLHCFASRMGDLLAQWDDTLTQANVVYRETDLTDEESRAFHESVAAGRGRVKFRAPPAAAS